MTHDAGRAHYSGHAHVEAASSPLGVTIFPGIR
jgi:hypothetical protein